MLTRAEHLHLPPGRQPENDLLPWAAVHGLCPCPTHTNEGRQARHHGQSCISDYKVPADGCSDAQMILDKVNVLASMSTFFT